MVLLQIVSVANKWEQEIRVRCIFFVEWPSEQYLLPMDRGGGWLESLFEGLGLQRMEIFAAGLGLLLL